MRPYNNGTTPSKRAGGGAKKRGVKKSLVKAKVSVVKTTRRVASGGAGLRGGELGNLLEQSVVSTPSAKQQSKKSPARSKQPGDNAPKKVVSAANLRKQLKKLQGNAPAESPRRTSSRRAQNGVTNGAAVSSPAAKRPSPLDISVEVAQEATEDAVDGGGPKSLLRKTVSKIWGGVPYTSMDDSPTPTDTEAAAGRHNVSDAGSNSGSKRSSCVVS